MLQQPKSTKFRKMHTGKNRGKAPRGCKVSFGEYGLKTKDYARITARQLESARRAINRYLKRSGTVTIRLFTDRPVTKKPIEVRMGKGKGNVEYWVCLVQPGRVMIEIAGVSEQMAREAFKLASAKLPVKTEFVVREIK